MNLSALSERASQNQGSSDTMAFSFGEPESVLSNSIADYLGLFLDPQQEYYTPPVSQMGLAKLLRANGHHNTIPYFKRNMLCRWYVDNDVLSAGDLAKAGFEQFVFGHCYFQKIFDKFGRILKYKHLPAISMRRLKEADRYCMLIKGKDPIKFKPGEVEHLKEYDPCQQIYGIPQYLGGIHSVMLSEDSTLFRRKYFKNGAHMGYIFYTNDPNMDKEDEKLIKEKIKQSKGVGNFRSMYLNIPKGTKDSVRIIPVGDIATKDEFERVKNITRNDILAMWRINGALAGIMPENSGGFGDLDKITRNNYENEVVPDQQVFLQLNKNLIKERHIQFDIPEFAKPKG